MLENASVLLVKPDGLSSPQKLASVYTWIARMGLRVQRELDLTLPENAVLDIWPKFADQSHLFSATMLRRYVGVSPVKAIFVIAEDGQDVIAQCRLVRKRVREEFGDSMFANVVHTPADDEERVGNLRFFESLELKTTHCRHADTSAGRGRYGRFASISEQEMTDVVELVWKPRTDSSDWIWLKSDPQSGTSVVWLLPGSDNSVDFEVSVLCEVFPDAEIGWCVERFVEGEIFGRAPIASGDPNDLAQIAQRLAASGVRVEIGDGRGHDPADPAKSN